MPSKRYNSKRSFGTRFNDIKETFEVVNKQIPPDEIASSAVTYEQLEINSIDTTTINYGGISASNFSEGAKIASGESNQRVPSELTDVSYWVQVTSGYAELHKQGFHNNEDIQHVEATSDGILFTPEVDEPARIYLTGRIPIPKSRKVFSTWEADRATNLRLIWWKNSHPVEVTNTFTTAGVATITTATAHGWTVGNEIRVTGLEVDYDGYHTITAVDTFSISYTSPTLTVSDNLNDVQWETRGSVNLEDYVYEELVDKVVWDANYRTANVSNKVLTSNVATLTINASHEFVVGDTVVVGEIDNTFNGTYKITAVTDTTLSYQIVRDPAPSDVVSTAVSPAIQITANDSRSATEYSVYVEIPANDPTLLLESAKVFEVIGYGAKQPLYANVNNSSLTNNVATLTIVDATGNFAVDSSVVVSNVGSPYDGTHIISGVDPASNTFTYNLINANVTSAVANGKAVAYDGKQRSELTPEGLRLYEPNGSLAVDLSTAGNSVFNIYSGGEVVTSIDSDGGAVFTSVDSNSFILDGTDLVGTFEDATFNGYAYNRFNTANVANGESETSNSYLNRLARGSVYEGYTSFLSNFTLTTANTYYTLGSGYFIPSFGRSYIFQVSFGSLNITNNSDEAVQAIIRMGTGPLSIGGANTFTLRSVVGSSTIGTLDTISTQFDTLNTFTSSRVIGKRIQSNVVTLLLEDDTFDGITTDNADKIGVTGSGYPYNGYWDVITSTVATSANVVSYNLAGTARGPNSTSTPRTVTTNINSGERGVFVANTAGLYSGFPLTKVSGTGVFGAGAVVNVITNATHFTTNVNHVTSGTMTFSVVQFIDTSASTAKVTEELQLFSATMPAESPIYYTVELLCPEPNVSVSGNFGSSPATTSTITVSLIDIGQAKTSAFQEISDAGRTAVGSQAPEFDTGGGGGTVVKTVTKVADQSAYYDNYGRGTGTTNPYAYKDSLYQGNPGTASGTKKSAVRFPALGLPAGSTVLKAELYLRNRHSYLSSGLTAYIGAHIDNDLENQTTAPLGRNFSTTNNPPVGGDNADTPDTFSTTFARGQGKWVTLPNSWYKAIADETVRGVLIGLTGVPNTWYSGLTDYGYFDGYEMNDEPKLRITYQYTE